MLESTSMNHHEEVVLSCQGGGEEEEIEGYHYTPCNLKRHEVRELLERLLEEKDVINCSISNNINIKITTTGQQQQQQREQQSLLMLLQNLQSLKVDRMKLRNPIGQLIAKTIVQNSHCLEVLDMSRNMFTNDTFIALAEVFDEKITQMSSSSSSLCRLKELDLSHNNFSSNTDDADTAIATIIQKLVLLQQKEQHNSSRVLERVALCKCNIGINSALAVADLLRNDNIIELNLGGNVNIGDEGGTIIAKSLQNNTKLKFLQLYNCNLGERFVFALASVLNSTSIESIRIDWNENIGDKGSAAIALALGNNTSIKAFNISWCGLGNQFHIALASSLKQNRVLQKLGIQQGEGGTGGGGKEGSDDDGSSKATMLVKTIAISNALEENNLSSLQNISGTPSSRSSDIDIANAATKLGFYLLLNQTNRKKYISGYNINDIYYKKDYIDNMALYSQYCKTTCRVPKDSYDKISISWFYYCIRTNPEIIIN